MMSFKNSAYQYLIFSIFLFRFTSNQAQVQLAFQGGESGNSWGFVSSGADATAQAQSFLANNIVSGAASLVAGGNTGGGSCIDGGSGNGPNAARSFTFNPVNIASSSVFFRTLTFHWGTRQPICVGTGWDSGENLIFTAYHDGIAQPSETLAVGNNNANFSIQSSVYTHQIPPCVSSFYFHISVTTNRRDELLFLDNVELSAPQINSGGSTGTNVNLTICASDLPYNWNGIVFNQAGSQTVTLTSSFGCDSLVNYILAVNNLTAPTFSQPLNYCSGAAIPSLPSTSLNGIIGTWSPNINNTITTNYTFTPNANQCAANASVLISILPNVTPTFNPIGPFCSGSNVPTLPSSSLNGISGTWSPSINNTTTTNYLFTPNIGLCATNAQLTVAITPNEIPLFDSVGAFCAGASIPPLPTTSVNNISGAWFPALNNQQTSTYTFQPSAGICAVSVVKTIEIQQNIEPTFSSPGTFCIGANIPELPTISNNGIQGIWSPSINNQQTTNYIFSPTPGECAVSTNLSIPVALGFIPEFNNPGPICFDTPLTDLPNTSLNGINGTWSPPINNTITTTYSFSPLPNQCAQASTMTIEVVPNELPIFPSYGTFCQGSLLPDLPISSLNGYDGSWSEPLNNQQTTTYTFTPSAGECAVETSLTLQIEPSVLPEFAPYPSFCFGSQINDLPNMSLNGITGSWNFPVNNELTTTYTFSPDSGVCALNTSLSIIINPIDSLIANISICQNELPYSWEGLSIMSSGIHVLNLINNQGCDSILILNLSVLPTVVHLESVTICPDDFPYTFFNMTITSPGLYDYLTNNSSGCDTNYVLNLNVHQPPTLSFSQTPVSTCDEPLSVVYSLENTQNLLQCAWSLGGQSGTNCDEFPAILTEIGCYDLFLETTDGNGCTSSLLQTNMACIHPNPVASFYVENGSGETGQAIQPINQTQNAQVFFWDFGDQSLVSGPNPIHVYDLAGNYEITLTAINEFGCQDSFTNLILITDPTIIYVPNAFTPGGFDLNEIFLPVVSSGVDRNNYSLLVFNRWGEVMFESRHPEIGWDGSYGNFQAPSGVYVWQIGFQNAQGLNETRQGHVSLLR